MCRLTVYSLAICIHTSAIVSAAPLTHAPMRPLPTASNRTLTGVPNNANARFVDPVRGDDTRSGDAMSPWKTLAYALRQLRPGDVLYLRGGVYYEKPVLSQSGTEQQTITIRSYPGEQAIIDGGLPEFLLHSQSAWVPFPDGAPGEFVSTNSYRSFDQRRVPYQFLPGAWEPFWGIEDQRPLALGHFADSMIPLHGYRDLTDLRSENELWFGKRRDDDNRGIYCGPGLWFNRATGRIHVRLARHRLDGLGDRAYRGETDPRKVPMVIAIGSGEDVLRINGIRHVRLQHLVFRGATGSPMIHVYGSEDIAIEHCTVYGGSPAMMINASKNIRVTHSAFRGLAAPWTSRAHMKYRGTPSYQIVLRNDQPRNEDIEFGWCEFTDDHDFAFIRFVKNLHFHHNYVDNFNDDGLECGAKLRDQTLFIYQNRIGRCLIPLTQHQIDRDESPTEHDVGSGVYLYRNVIDLRGGTYKSPPSEPDPDGKYLHGEGHLVGDHGSPIWPVMYAYHNTILRETPVFRNYFLFGLGAQATRHTERDVFNNIFVQMDRMPGVAFVGMKEAAAVREGGNLIWGMKEGPTLKSDPFAKFRASPLFESSKTQYEPGWTTLDRVADPRFVRLPADARKPADLRLQPDSPAIDAGVILSAEWPDPLRDQDTGRPDSGALPSGIEPWSIGVDGRRSLFEP